MVWKFGDNIDTDQIIPAKYLSISDPRELGRHCMEDNKRTNFASLISSGDFIVAGNNFGCGSSREEAPFVLKEIGIKVIIAKSFSRIFLRNAINIGLSVIDCAALVDETSEGDELEIDLSKGKLKNITTSQIYQSQPMSEFLLQIINDGGLVNFVQKELQKNKEDK